MYDEFVLEVNNIGKKYKMYDRPIDRLNEMFTKKNKHKDFWALKNVSFKLRKGECFGIVGQNGSGKSTLLKIIAGTLKQTTGSINTDKKIAALLELGSGFNPDFTGKENVYLSGSLFGISKTEMKKKISRYCKFC